jgi:GDP-L-fucose synthase
MMSGQSVLVVGGRGFLGQHVCGLLEKSPVAQVIVPCGSRDSVGESAIAALVRRFRPDTVIYLPPGPRDESSATPAPATPGNGRRRGCRSRVAGLQLLEAARRYRVHNVVYVPAMTAYRRHVPAPCAAAQMRPSHMRGIEFTTAPANKTFLRQVAAYRQLFGVRFLTLLPVDVYGPQDRFRPSARREIPGLIRNIITARFAGLAQVELRGDATAQREFIFVRDMAEAIVLAAEHSEHAEPVAIGSGSTIALRDLAAMIAELCGFQGPIVWRHDASPGRPCRAVDTGPAERSFGFTARTTLEDGLAETIAWYWNKLAAENRQLCGIRLKESEGQGHCHGNRHEVHQSAPWTGPGTD